MGICGSTPKNKGGSENMDFNGGLDDIDSPIYGPISPKTHQKNMGCDTFVTFATHTPTPIPTPMDTFKLSPTPTPTSILPFINTPSIDPSESDKRVRQRRKM